MTTITQIAKSLKMTPKNARAKLRASKNAPKGNSKSRWVFAPADAAKVKKLLSA